MELTHHAAPPDIPLTPQQKHQLDSLVRELDERQLHWLRGYLAGFEAARTAGDQYDAAASEPQGPIRAPLTILFGSQTGNAQSLAEALQEQAREHKLEVKCYDMGDYPLRQLKKEKQLAIITSTHGEGDPPDDALELHEFLHSRKAPKLEGIRYAVLALGDSSYEYFCQTGKDFDERLKALGAEPILERVDCDVDYDQASDDWMTQLLARLEPSQTVAGSPRITEAPQATINPKAESASAPRKIHYDRKHPYQAELLDRICLNGRGASKQVYHIELSLEDSGLSYQPGDSLGVYVENRLALIEPILKALKLKGTEPVELTGQSVPLTEALKRHLELTRLTRPTVDRWAKLSGAKVLKATVDNHRKLMNWMRGRDLLDLIESFPIPGLDAQTLVNQVRKLPPRLYSIASSQAAVDDEVHLTVAAVRHNTLGRERQGVASTWLAERLSDTAPVFIDTNKNFKLPKDPSTPIIMVGPGTGVAPFRAFMQEREAKEHQGKNWLFFGDRHFRTDFLYQAEWLQWRKKGLLNRIDVAFSRETTQKIYVQHRIRQAAKEVWSWLEEGAHFYVCGDANAMAPDVNEALLDVVMAQGKKSREQAEDYLRELTKTKRYQRDVY